MLFILDLLQAGFGWRFSSKRKETPMKTTNPLLALITVACLTQVLQAQPPPGERFRRPGGPREFAAAPLAKNDAEQKILNVLDDMNKTSDRGTMSVPREDGRFLRLMSEAIGAKHVVELGTSHGYSGIWFCLALRTTGGKLTTYEINPQRASAARENFKRAGVDAMVTLVEGDAHVEVAKQKDPIDLVFIDADKEGYADYLKQLLPLVRPGGLIVAHNIEGRMADPAYIKAITSDALLETSFINAGGSGISVTLKKR